MSPDEPPPLDVDLAPVIEIGMALWGVALVVSLLVPALHQDERHWWPWACVAGLVGGGIALYGVRRVRRGNTTARHG